MDELLKLAATHGPWAVCGFLAAVVALQVSREWFKAKTERYRSETKLLYELRSRARGAGAAFPVADNQDPGGADVAPVRVRAKRLSRTKAKPSAADGE